MSFCTKPSLSYPAAGCSAACAAIAASSASGYADSRNHILHIDGVAVGALIGALWGTGHDEYIRQAAQPQTGFRQQLHDRGQTQAVTEEIDFEALRGRAFTINGETYEVTIATTHQGVGRKIVWAAQHLTATGGWEVGSTIWLGLEVGTSRARSAPQATISKADETPVNGPFGIEIIFNEVVTGFETTDLVLSNAVLDENGVTRPASADGPHKSCRDRPAPSAFTSRQTPLKPTVSGIPSRTPSKSKRTLTLQGRR